LELARKVRGTIIDQAIEVEQELNDLLVGFFVSDVERRQKFLQSVLQDENFTFMRKVMLLERLDVHHQARFQGLFDGLTGDLSYIVGVRNSLAHRPHNSLVPMIKLKLPGGIVERKLDNTFLVEYLKVAKTTCARLVALAAYIEMGL